MASIKRLLRPIFFTPWIKRIWDDVPVVQKIYSGWERKHPFDREFGTDTSGCIPREQIHPDPAIVALISGYAGCQPTIVRRTFQMLGDVQDYTFVDLGCGKGRATLIASEFPFREVIGVELSPKLAHTARLNAEKIAQRFKDRPNISILKQNVSDFDLPKGKLVLYMYQAFGTILIAELIRKLENSLTRGWTTHAYIVYANPVYWEGLDSSHIVQRWFAKTFPYDPSERGFGPDESDSVVIWQTVIGAVPDFDPKRRAEIVIANSGLRAGLADGPAIG